MSSTNDQISTPLPQSPFKDSHHSNHESPWANLIFNIFLPVLVLNNGSKWFPPQTALMVALAFPLVYGSRDYLKTRKINFFSLFGLVNVAVTGGLALMQMQGIWFSVKEAFFPALIGIFTLFSAQGKSPLILKLLFQPQVFNLLAIEKALERQNRIQDFWQMLRTGTVYLAGSFFLSSLLNFLLAQRIFVPTPAEATEIEASQIINEQIAQMTSSSFLVIMLPSMLALGVIYWWVLRQLKEITGLKMEEFLKN